MVLMEVCMFSAGPTATSWGQADLTPGVAAGLQGAPCHSGPLRTPRWQAGPAGQPGSQQGARPLPGCQSLLPGRQLAMSTRRDLGAAAPTVTRRPPRSSRQSRRSPASMPLSAGRHPLTMLRTGEMPATMRGHCLGLCALSSEGSHAVQNTVGGFLIADKPSAGVWALRSPGTPGVRPGSAT